MAIREIREDGDDVLRKKSKTVELVDGKVKQLIEDMLETLYKNNGVGLAAPQVGILKRIIVIDIYDGKGPIILINPEIIKEKGTQEVDEGCLSFPNQYAKVIIPAEVTVKALNENGEEVKIKGKELLAQALSHEIDYLNGALSVDKVLPGTLGRVNE